MLPTDTWILEAMKHTDSQVAALLWMMYENASLFLPTLIRDKQSYITRFRETQAYIEQRYYELQPPGSRP